MNEIRSDLNRNLLINVGFAGFFHFLVDFFPISTFYFVYQNDVNLFYWILFYNVLAFALQPFIGFIIDRFEMTKKYFCCLSIALVILGAFIPLVYISFIFLGLGNAMFHVAFSKDILKESESSVPLGIFIAPGVLGLGIGLSFLNEIIRFVFLGIGVFLYFLYIFYSSYFEKNPRKNDKISGNFLRKYRKIETSKINYIILIFLVVFSIFFRGSLGKLTPSINITYFFLVVSIVSFEGKIIGGFIPKGICLMVSILTCIISSIFIEDLTGIIFFTLAINILMPLTLDYLRKLLYEFEATSLGLSAFFLLVPNLLLLGINEEMKKATFVAFVVLHLLILLYFLIFEILSNKSKIVEFCRVFEKKN